MKEEEEEGGVREEFKMACGKGRVLIMGDFNLPGIDWVQEPSLLSNYCFLSDVNFRIAF